ncbi:MAG: FadR family transcriptional regulator [Desulfuromonas sp.]|jgi:DNA-binding FadR family transcriptional regulator|nr:MAG: FadR family transcriptional regulator [Desulfuromonas sp.]
MAINFQPPVTESLAKQIAENIRSAIVDGSLKVDDQLPTEEVLAEKYNVSRPTIREALKRLAAQNLIRSRRGPTGGTFVNRPSQEELRSSMTGAAMLMVSMGKFSLSEIAEARRELELICCRLAAERREEEQLQIMAEEIVRQKNPQTTDVEFCASDVRFHRAMVDATGNPVMQFVMFAVIEALQPATNLVIFRFRERHKIIAQHEHIYQAIKDQKIEVAEAAMAEQMNYLCEQYAQAQEWRRERDEERSD